MSTWRFETAAGERQGRTPAGRRRGGRCGLRGERGVALVAALAVMALVAAIGLGLALTTSLEPLAAASYETSWSARLAAEAGLAAAAHELGAAGDWNAVLGGELASGVLGRAAVSVELPDGSRAGLQDLTNLATCGHAAACTDPEAAAFAVGRPWGPNNPRWRVFGSARLDQVIEAGAGLPPIDIVVWTADDPAEADGDPLHDTPPGSTGPRPPGACTVAVRAEAFAPRLGHAAVVGVVTRPGPACRPGARLAAWHAFH